MKILYYIYGLNIGGAESFIFNVLTKIDMKKYHIDFILQSEKNENAKLIDLARNKGCHFFYIEPFFNNPIKSCKELKQIAKDYNILHVHINAMINISPILIGRQLDIPVIVHSHNTSSNKGNIGNIIHFFNRAIWNKKICRVSCGKEAGRWMFCKKDFQVIDNGINLNSYRFSNEYRNELRNKYQIGENDVVIGNIGRFVEAKNHKFILECFVLFQKQHENSWLVLVGDGELKEELENKAKEMQIKNVIFTGNIHDAYKYYSMFDCMLFPSIFEGLPFTLIEAQASGLPIVASDSITKDVNVTKTINYCSLNNTASDWCEIIETSIRKNYGINRTTSNEKMIGSIYDVETSVKKLERIYTRLSVREEKE
jgi:glycosyltransferase involved in cell wall biosynthesis